MDQEPIILSIDRGLATISLNRPAALNGIDMPLARGLMSAIEEVRAQPELRCLLLKGEGSAFSVGGDLRRLSAHADSARPDEMRTLVATYNRAVLALSDLELPIVAAVHGSVAGGALGLVCAADIVVAAHDTIFTCAYSKLGLTADGGVSWFLPRLVGLRKAQELLMLSPQFSADEALEWGLVSRTCPHSELDAVSRDLARALAGQSRTAASGQRLLLRDASTRPLSVQLELETDTMWRSASESSFADRVTQFVGSRSGSRRSDAEERGTHDT